MFSKNLGGALQDKVIGALSVPLADDPMSAYRYLNARRSTLQDAYKQRPLIRLQDKNLNQLATIGQEMSCVTEDTAPSWKTRWGGKIKNINIKRDSSGIHTVELVATSNREHLKTTLIGSTPLFPPEVQPIKMWFLPANCRTACAVTLWIQFLRAFDPIASIPTNIFNPGGWINPLGPDALLNLLPTYWPLQVAFVNPLLDQSRTSLLTGAWTDFHSSTVDMLKDAGVCARAYTYFTDDVDNPHPELEAAVGKEVADLARPQRNCVVVAFEDHSGYSGPTGSAADGVINLFSSTLDDLITETVFPVDANDDGQVDPVFRKLFGVAPPPPWAIYRDGQESGIIESGYFQHKGPVKTTMTGSKSPKLVNDLQTFAIRYAISQLAQVILGTEAPAVEGLDNLYQRPMANSITSCSRGSGTPTRYVPSTPATWVIWSASNAARGRHTPWRQSSRCAQGTTRPSRTAASRRPSATQRLSF
jgi:hypothetical protein